MKSHRARQADQRRLYIIIDDLLAAEGIVRRKQTGSTSKPKTMKDARALLDRVKARCDGNEV
jgi:hypothetical protein